MRETSILSGDHYKPGNHWMVCDSCGLVYRRSEMKKRWDGFWVCKKDWEPRHPQEFVRGKVDKVRVDVARPDSISGDISFDSPTTLETGWEDNGNGTYTATGTGFNSRVFFTTTLDADKYYSLQITITEKVTGSVIGFCGGLYTDTITEGTSSLYGKPAIVSSPVGFSGYYFEGTVYVKIREIITPDNL